MHVQASFSRLAIIVLVLCILSVANSMTADRTNDQQDVPDSLTIAALTAREPAARVAAVQKLADQSVLARLTAHDESREVREAAVARVTDQAVLAGIAMSAGLDVAFSAIAGITDQNLLAQIADGRSTLERARVEIGTLDATFRSEPVEVQRLLVNYTGLFSEHLPRIEASIRQCDELWRDVSTWDGRKRHAELMAARAILHRSLGDDRMAHETAVYLVNQFTAKLESARERVTATRR